MFVNTTVLLQNHPFAKRLSPLQGVDTTRLSTMLCSANARGGGEGVSQYSVCLVFDPAYDNFPLLETVRMDFAHLKILV